jgi:hypothetical protein
VLDSPQTVMEKAEVARNALDWTTYVSLLTPETHENLVLQELHVHLLSAWGQNALQEQLGKPPLKPEENRPLMFALNFWGKQGINKDKLQELAAMPKSPERTAALRAIVAALPNKQAIATELWSRDAIKRGFRPRKPGEKPEVEVSGFIGNVEIKGDRAYVMAHASVNGAGMQHQTELHLTPLGWRIHLAKYYAIGIDE